MKRQVLALCVAVGVALTVSSINASAADDVDTAYTFFREGGVWRVRLMPDADAEKQVSWSVLVLCGKGAKPKAGEVGGFELAKPLASPADAMVTIKVASVFQDARRRGQFVSRFAEGIGKGEVQAFAVPTPPLKEGQAVAMAQAVALDSRAFLGLFESKAK